MQAEAISDYAICLSQVITGKSDSKIRGDAYVMRSPKNEMATERLTFQATITGLPRSSGCVALLHRSVKGIHVGVDDFPHECLSRVTDPQGDEFHLPLFSRG